MRLFNLFWENSSSNKNQPQSTQRAQSIDAFLCVLCVLCGFSNYKIIKSLSIIVTVFIAALIIIGTANTGDGESEARGGNITSVEITSHMPTDHWQGYYGLIADETSPVYPDYFNMSEPGISNIRKLELGAAVSDTDIILITNSSKIPVLSELRAGNTATIDALLGRGYDSGANTFMEMSSYQIVSIDRTITNVPTAYTFVDSKPQSDYFKMGLLEDNEGSLVFIVPLSSVPKQGYDRGNYFFQFILPNNYSNPQIYYMYYILQSHKLQQPIAHVPAMTPAALVFLIGILMVISIHAIRRTSKSHNFSG